MPSLSPSRTFGSVSVAMVTPMNSDGSIDIPSSRRLARHLVKSGCDALVLNGTTGESPTTHQPEKDELVAAIVDEVGAEAMIIAGAGSNDTAHAVRIAEAAQRTGAHGLLVVSPYYNRPSQEGVYQHIRAVVDSVDLPVMLYDIPGRTGVAIGDEILDRLAEHPRVLAVKDATGDVAQGFERMRRTGLEFYSGDDALNLAWLTHGASGVVSVVGHVVAGRYVDMVRAIDAGDLATARDLSAGLTPVLDALMGGGQGAVMAKAALALQGIIARATVRLPLVEPSDTEISDLRAVLRAHGLLEEVTT
ncbi:4-hydroxy-tetrahydrodipicolinate synthase [Occultella gossypii]|uniref:4-hydroxy-tetrahydrodipicolinate synthase n=1 Tax=Occultella gossypii TaxID=2800820 RepID=A0ABS7S6D4_9MICO|nr:4-hydroxy-tetrahydrodipicolinate synthase [Occultella gossypii]MBZ2195919.1 4-hydroxy-tetrahydrodipicolinate synthase [Occultella gossypii]